MSKNNLRTLKDLGKDGLGLVGKTELRAEAIKWVKEDLRLLGLLTIPNLRKIAIADLERWMERFNITEDDLK